MQPERTLARPYARAAHRHALASGRQAQWATWLAQLGALVREPRLARMLKDPAFDGAQRADMLLGLLDDRDEGFGNFVRQLSDNGRLALAPWVGELFEEQRIEHSGQRRALVQSARPLDDAAQADIKSRLEKRCGSAVAMRCAVEPGLLGGLRIDLDGRVTDLSLRGRLAALNEALTT